MLRGLSIAFVGTLVAIPVIGQITPESAQSQLATATGQAVLAMVAVVEFIVLGVFFKGWRKDVASDKDLAKENAITLQKLLADNSVALSQNADASHRTAKSLDKFSEAVNRNTEVIRKCDRS